MSIYYDAPVQVEPGHGIRTPSGRSYLVLDARQQQRGLHVGRWHLHCLVIERLPSDIRVWMLYWYRRRRRKP